MKGVVLAGGKGSRLRPMTRVVNKHVIPIYDQPMIYYPVNTLADAGIDEIMIISNADHIGKYIELLENESDFDIDFSYKVQSEPKGIAHAVGLAEQFVDDEFVVILGDNIILEDLGEKIGPLRSEEDARIFLKQVSEPSAYGVASVDNEGHVIGLEEKPENPESNDAVVGLYVFDSQVFDVISDLTPSERGEYEITDVNRQYLRTGTLRYERIDGSWYDAGTPEGVFQASADVRDRRRED
ncbi:sugar nucleotidyltransferase [Haloplanus halobius]|uniref:sugar nucleotidyltransferase n=1 Tax=Haloplanus halobius TaxID=2934938 RepID=UPI00200FAB33|nr:sugar phosphate nucleotidyltransferase [Haloplanus sp. XH21]